MALTPEKQAIAARKWYLKNRDLAIRRAAIWSANNRLLVLQMKRKSTAKHRDRRLTEKRKFYAANKHIWIKYKRTPEASRAHYAVSKAVKNGVLIRPESCSQCGKECKPQGHHHRGYAVEFHLDVVWLCMNCHQLKHSPYAAHYFASVSSE